MPSPIDSAGTTHFFLATARGGLYCSVTDTVGPPAIEFGSGINGTSTRTIVYPRRQELCYRENPVFP